VSDADIWVGFWRLAVASIVVSGSAWLLFRRFDHPDRRFLLRVALLGLALRLSLALVLHQTDFYLVFAPDSRFYHQRGLLIRDTLHALQPFIPYVAESTRGIILLNGLAYALFGPIRALPLLAVAVFGVANGLIAYHLTASLGYRRAGRRAAVLVTFFPSLVLWSSLDLKDPLSTTAVLVVVTLLHKLAERFSFRHSLLLLVAMAASGLFRYQIFLILIVAAPAALGWAALAKGGREAASFIAVVLVVALLPTLFDFGFFGVGFLGEFGLEDINAIQASLAREGESAYGGLSDVSTVGGALRFLPTGVFYFFFAPMPHQTTGSLSSMLALPEMFVFYFLLIDAVRGLARLATTKLPATVAVTVPILAIALAYSLAEGAIGDLYRHRSQVLPPLLVLSAIGWSTRSARRRLSLWRRGRRSRSARGA